MVQGGITPRRFPGDNMKVKSLKFGKVKMVDGKLVYIGLLTGKMYEVGTGKEIKPKRRKK